MERKKRILILTADAGFGHRSAANAVAAALQEKYADQCKVEVLNPLDDKRTPILLRDSQSDYDKLVRKAPELYRLGYDASDATIPSALMESAVTVMLYEVMRDMIRKYEPDAILTTYPLYQAPLAAVYSLFRTFIPTSAVITDLATVHRMWFNPSMDTCLVPTTVVQDLAINYGVAAEKVHVTGIPVHPNIPRETRSKAEIRRELGWNDQLTILAVGSRRVTGLMEILNVVNHFGIPLQLVVVAGKDEETYADLKQTNWHIPVHLYEFVSDMPAFMHASDLIICKAGGLIVTESLACGLPMMLIDVIPGQETGNAEYVIQNGAGEQVSTPIEALETLMHFMQNGQSLLKYRAKNAKEIGRPNSAFDIADILMDQARGGPVRREVSRIISRPHILELLTDNQISFREDESLDTDQKD